MPGPSRFAAVAAWGLVLVAAIGFVLLHRDAGLTLPTPWPDEAHFLWPARSFATAGTLHAPELHPDRALFWMPPGYSVVLGVLFAVGGTSLELARWYSAAALVGAGFVALRWWSAGGRIPAALAISWLLLAPEAVVGGNIARMEGLELLLVVLGFSAVAAQRRERALAWFVFAALVHPAGIAFGLTALVLWRKTQWSRELIDRILLAASLLGLVALAVWLGSNAGAFIDDATFQFARKGSRDLISPWLDRRTVLLGTVVFAAWFSARDRPVHSLLAFAFACLLVRNLGQEMWYAIYDVWFYAAMAVATSSLVRHRLAAAPGRFRCTATLVAPLAVLALGWVHVPRTSASLRWRGMAPSAAPYTTEHTLDTVAEALTGRTSVEVLPHGDAALFLARPQFSIIDPVRHPFEPRALLVHTSDHQLRAWQPALREALSRGTSRIVADDEGGRWHLVMLQDPTREPE